jgi:hypothetical protein
LHRVAPWDCQAQGKILVRLLEDQLYGLGSKQLRCARKTETQLTTSTPTNAYNEMRCFLLQRVQQPHLREDAVYRVL